MGDIFSVKLDNGNQRFFQYITKDRSVLNRDEI